MLAGIVDAQQDLAELGQRRQRLQRLRRHGRDPEHDHPARQVPRRRIGLGQARQEPAVHARPALDHSVVARVVQHRAPQGGLPAVFRAERHCAAPRCPQHVAPVLPIVQPIGAVDLVLVEQIRQPLGQLMALAHAVVVGQETPQRQEDLVAQHLRQQAQQAPGQSVAVQRGRLGQQVPAQHGAIGAPEKTGRQLHVHRGRDPASLRPRLLRRIGRQRELQPLRDAVALHQDDFVLERRQRIPLHPRHRQPAQLLQPIAVDDHETRSER